MAKILSFGLASDLHLEFGYPTLDQMLIDTDYLVIAGDTAEARHFGKYFTDNNGMIYPFFKALSDHYKQIILILGNHEYYFSRIDKAEEIIRKFAALFPNVTVLQNETITLEGKTVFGGTMWTDMMQEPYLLETRMGDFKYITVRDRGSYHKFRAVNAIKLHLEALKAIKEAKPDVVITHHAPHKNSVDEKYADSLLNAAYYTTRADFTGISLWCHGHMHSEQDYIVDDCRVVANPRGYVGYEASPDWKVKKITC